MARIYPFRALRYNLARVSAQDVVTQPYDKITPAMQQAYYQRSPWNLSRIILRLPELFDADGAAYLNAARDFAAWRADGILAQEREPCIFACSQTFALPGQPGVVKERRGFIALGELTDDRQGVVFPHKQPQPSSDRLELLRATRAHFGQIFMLYSDPARTAEQLLFGAGEATLPEIEVTDEYGVVHKIWKISDPAKINLLTTLLEDKKLIIADGHQRYEAALRYARERAPAAMPESCERATGGLQQPAYPEAAAMMTFVNMDSEGLVILPTHRAVFGLPNFDRGQLLEGARSCFEVQALPVGDAAAGIARLNQTEAPAIIAVMAQGSCLLTVKPSAADKALRNISPRLRRLDAVLLDRLILERLLGITAENASGHLRFLRDPAEAVDQVARGEAQVSFLVKPVSLDQLREAAFAGEPMPPKSTDFYPNLLSGLAIYALD